MQCREYVLCNTNELKQQQQKLAERKHYPIRAARSRHQAGVGGVQGLLRVLRPHGVRGMEESCRARDEQEPGGGQGVDAFSKRENAKCYMSSSPPN